MIGTFWALVPAIVAIALALWTKEVYSSLFIGIVIGGIFYAIETAAGFPGFFNHIFSVLLSWIHPAPLLSLPQSPFTSTMVKIPTGHFLSALL